MLTSPGGDDPPIPAHHPLLAKLEMKGPLPAADRELLHRMLQDIRTFGAHRDIIAEGDAPKFVHLMIAGWACRYRLLRNGRRQITAFLLPGDFCDVHVTMLGRMDHSIGTLDQARVAFISNNLMMEVALRPALTHALWWASLVDEGTLRAWLVNLGRRNALERVAHLVCELFARLSSVHLMTDEHFALPLRQEDLGDALGLTPVHVNRVLRQLREAGLMTLTRGTITVGDLPGLRQVAGFDPSYLHLND